MQPLNEQQLNQIKADVAKAGITIPHLQDELHDHICCEVESLMCDGLSFDQAYVKISAECGMAMIQKIEEDTLISINQQYAMMKTTMKISGTISMVLIALGTLLHILHLVGANIFLVAGFVGLTWVFFPTAIFIKYRDQQQSKIMSIFMAIGCDLIAAAILFKIMHWNGANIMLVLGSVILLGIILPNSAIQLFKKEAVRAHRFIYLMGILGLFLFELATLFKFMHWPGAAILLVTGAVLMVSVFLPLYAFKIFNKQNVQIPSFIFIVIMTVYLVTMTSLMSFSGKSTPQTNPQITSNVNP